MEKAEAAPGCACVYDSQASGNWAWYYLWEVLVSGLDRFYQLDCSELCNILLIFYSFPIPLNRHYSGRVSTGYYLPWKDTCHLTCHAFLPL